MALNRGAIGIVSSEETMKLLVAIPALNEEMTIAHVISDIKEHLPHAAVLVIDDGSIDQTAEIARRAGANVVSMPFNVGVGGALRTAFKYAKNQNFTHLLQIDADGQHLPSEAKNLLLYGEKDTIVVGSRFLQDKSSYKTEFLRRFAMKSLASLTSLICKTKLTDVTSGFRLASGKAIEIFSSEYPREYLGDTVESLIIAHRAGITIREVPVSMKHREFGKPSQNYLKSSWYLLRVLLITLLALFKK